MTLKVDGIGGGGIRAHVGSGMRSRFRGGMRSHIRTRKVHLLRVKLESLDELSGEIHDMKVCDDEERDEASGQ